MLKRSLQYSLLFLTALALASCGTLQNTLKSDSDETAQSTEGNATATPKQPTVRRFIPDQQFEAVDNQEQCVPFDNQRHHPEDNQIGPIKPSPDLWQRTRDGFQLVKLDGQLHSNNPRIISQRNWYARHNAYFKRVSERTNRYMYYIVEELEKRNMPVELALLPIVESAYDPFAYSHGRASGIWQFIPGTGKAYGLDKDWWYDGRRDVTASTQAALNYLQDLHKRFDGNWLHALAAYNSGQGTVSKAIRKQKKKGRPTDFWSLDLPKETRAYVPKLLALSQLVANPSHYQMTLPALANQAYFAQVDIGSQIDLAKAAELADISIDEIYRLNPGYNRWATKPEGPHVLLVPYGKAALFEQNLAKIPANERIQWLRYTIRSGDSLLLIAKKFKTTPETLKLINDLRSNIIRAGKTLLVPKASAPSNHYKLSEQQRLSRIKARAPGKGKQKRQYLVKRGDSFWTISRKFGTTHRQLAKWNGMAPTDPLRAGQKLVVWLDSNNQRGTAQALIGQRKPTMRRVGYTVRNGDSLARIASKFNVRVRDIVNWNSIDPKRYLQPGQRLTLHVDVTDIR